MGDMLTPKDYLGWIEYENRLTMFIFNMYMANRMESLFHKSLL
jgi:hypothetical protein